MIGREAIGGSSDSFYSNPEYDRALVEMTIRLAGLDDDHRDQVAEWIGVNR